MSIANRVQRLENIASIDHAITSVLRIQRELRDLYCVGRDVELPVLAITELLDLLENRNIEIRATSTILISCDGS